MLNMIEGQQYTIPGSTWSGTWVGAVVGGGSLSGAEGICGGAPDIWSLSHNSEQLVFQKPIFECSRSYITRVLRTIIPITMDTYVKVLQKFYERKLAV